jgi:hypothetical protein
MQVHWVYSWCCRRMVREGRGWYPPQLSVRKRNVCTKGTVTDGGMHHTGGGAQDRVWGSSILLSLGSHTLCWPQSSGETSYLFPALMTWYLPLCHSPLEWWFSGLEGGGLETSAVCRRKSLQGVYCRDQGRQGGPEPGWSADWGFGKEEGRGPGCLNSWGGLAIPLSPPSFQGLDAHPVLSYAGVLAAWESVDGDLSEQE